MSELVVGHVPLTSKKHVRIGEKLARKAIFKVMENLKVGSLTIHEGQDSYHIGTPGRPGEPQAEVHVHNPAVYGQVLTGGAIAPGEAYIQGHWSSPAPVEVTRLFSANLQVLETLDKRQSLATRIALGIAHRLNRNTREGSRENIAAHYDLGNEFFRLFLDPTMMYSSALFTDRAATLEAASEAKLDEICRQLELHPEDHLLEIGTGWGGMAIHAARNYGCRVTTTTISREQYEYACARVEKEGLEDRITLLFKDYRSLEGQYDKLVSIEMIEAVGHEFYGNYFDCCARLLKEDGKMVIQAITIADQRFEKARKSVDYIKRYIFPGGCLPSVAVIADNVAQHTDLQIVHLRDITQDYALTLAEWRRRFMERLDEVTAMGFDDSFIRLWDYYLSYCEGGFRERIISTVQLAFAKPGYRFDSTSV
jgi:cyclopropane-fatty-acyl-phospholipid synthase